MSDELPIIGYAVEVRDVTKTYGNGKKKVTALDGVTMCVPRGSIYGLLGPSGCGKTTLLRCIVGRLTADEGELLTLGERPGTTGHQVPGRMVGYMPQELALYNEFTIHETMMYFGRVHKMTTDHILERLRFLLEFLHLPEASRVIRTLSGGQQRRVSIAIALLQEPTLLILDEPTVGVDPLLRQSIWEHLLMIAHTSNITIIITTHYVEEARQAHVVGLLRNGRLLAEASPNELLRRHRLGSLEDVFLKLCAEDQSQDIERDDTRRQRPDKALSQMNQPAIIEGSENGAIVDERTSLLRNSLANDGQARRKVKTVTSREKILGVIPNGWNILALFIKNLTILKRNIGFLLFEFLLPSFQIVLFCLCIGGKPFGLEMAVSNNETSPEFGAIFLSHIDSTAIKQVNYSNHFNDALNSVRVGKTWGVIAIGENFTQDLILRFIQKAPVSNETLDGSCVHLYLDMTNQQIAYVIQLEMMTAFEKFAQAEFGQTASMPIKMEEPIYGQLNPSFTNFMAPGIVITIPFFMATGLTALAFVIERKQGLLDRSLVAGVGVVEIMIGHIMTQFLVMLIQVILLLVFVLAVFKVPNEGSLVLVVLLTVLQGLTGMAVGLLVSAICDEETSAIQVALGSVYPNLLLSGIIWPLEAMPYWLRYIGYAMPMTFAADGMRDILAKGWGLSYTEVWLGFVVTIAWGTVLMALSAVVMKLRKA